MMRRIGGLKMVALALCLMALGACTNTNKDSLTSAAPAAVPGTERDFTVNVGDRILFVVDQSTLTEEAKSILRRQAAWLKQYPNVTVRIEGHADERGTREYNIALSARRATVTKNFLIGQGIAASRISTIAYGKERPVASCDADSCYRQNRRAVTVVTGGAVSG